MDLNNIKLSPTLVADLYQSSLVEMNEQPIVSFDSTPDEQTKLKWLGENKKNVLVIVNHNDAVHLPDDDLNFLIGILGACKLGIADVAIVNLNNHKDLTYKELLAHFKSKTILLFGAEPTDLGLPLSFPNFQIQAFANSSFLSSPTLKQLEADKVLKSKLWVCLKKIFNL